MHRQTPAVRSACALVVFLAVTACGGGGDGGPGTQPPPQPSVTGVAVAPATRTLAVGERFTFSANVTVANGAATTVAWSSSDPTRATVNATTGEVTGVAPTGATPVTITATSTADATKSGTAAVTVALPTPARVDITPSPATVAVGATVPLVATAKDAQGNAISGLGAATWSVASQTVATVSAAGAVTGVSVGSTTVTATIAGVQGTATVDVTGAVRSVTVRGPGNSAANASLAVGATRQLSVTVAADPGVSAAVGWTTSDASVATVSGAGLVTVTGRGTATITATSTANPAAKGTATITGLGVSSVNVTPDGGRSVNVGGNATLTVAVAADQGIANTVTWTSRSPAVVTVAPTATGARVTGVSQGSAWVVATATADPTVRDSARVTVSAPCVQQQIFLGNNLTGSLDTTGCREDGDPVGVYRLVLPAQTAVRVSATSAAFQPRVGFGGPGFTRDLFEVSFVSATDNKQSVTSALLFPAGTTRIGVWSAEENKQSGTFGLSVVQTEEESVGCTQNIITSGVFTDQSFDDETCFFTNNQAYGEFDIYRFALYRGETATIEMNSGTLDSKLALWDTGFGTEVATDDNGGGGLHAKIVYTAPANAIHYLLARRSGNGRYQLRLTIAGRSAMLASESRSDAPAIFRESTRPFAAPAVSPSSRRRP